MQLSVRGEHSFEYIVRGHHAMSTCADSFVIGSPATLFEIHERIKKTTLELGFWVDPYSQDILGENPDKYSSQYNMKYFDFVRKFICLPDTAHIIINCEKDKICDACVYGKHCMTKEVIEKDRAYISQFINIAIKLGMITPEDYLVLEENSKLNAVVTTKRILVEILKNRTL